MHDQDMTLHESFQDALDQALEDACEGEPGTTVTVCIDGHPEPDGRVCPFAGRPERDCDNCPMCDVYVLEDARDGIFTLFQGQILN